MAFMTTQVTASPTSAVLLFNVTSITTTTTTYFGNLTNNTITTNTTKSNRIDNVFEPTAENVIEIVVLGILCVMILLGNSLVILAFIKGPRSIRTHTNYFVVNLAVCDFMVGCLSVPFWMCVKLKIASAEFSAYFITLDVLFGTTSILSLVAISIERMAAVRYATHHYNMSSRPVYASITLTWFIGLVLFGIKIWLGMKQLEEFTVSIFIVSFMLPLAVILFSYIVLFKSAYSLTRADNQTRSQSIRRDIRIAKTISIIIGLFVVCWAPFFTMNLMYVVCKRCLSLKVFVLLVSIAKFMHYSNSMMNFFVYAVRSPEFRKTFKALIFRCDTEHLRERMRTISNVSRKRGASLLLRRNNNNGDSCMDMELNNGKNALKVPSKSSKSNGYSVSFTSETYLSECPDTPSIGFYDYKYT